MVTSMVTVVTVRQSRSRIDNFLRTMKKKRKRRCKKKRNWNVVILVLTGVWSLAFPQAGRDKPVVWNTEIITDNLRPGLEMYQGIEKGTSTQDLFWKLADELDSSNRMERLVRSKSLWLSNKSRNRRMKDVNGNGSNNMVSIVHWNTGNRFWQQKTEMIEALIQDKNPDILFISEANMMSTVTKEQRHIEGYKMVLPNTMESLGYARLVLLVKMDIEFKVIGKFMGPSSACIWIHQGSRGRKPLKIGGFYRELSLLRQGTPNLSNSPNLQLARWNTMLEGWKAAAARDAACVIIGDINLDYLKWE